CWRWRSLDSLIGFFGWQPLAAMYSGSRLWLCNGECGRPAALLHEGRLENRSLCGRSGPVRLVFVPGGFAGGDGCAEDTRLSGAPDPAAVPGCLLLRLPGVVQDASPGTWSSLSLPAADSMCRGIG